MSTTIRCRQLYKQYQRKKKVVDAVNGLDLLVEQGECFGMLGPNGAGKTTTVEILEGLLKPTSGQVEVLGQQWGQGKDHEIRQRIGITLQETRFQEKLSVIEILRLFRSFYDSGIPLDDALSLVSLNEKASAWVRELSGGQKQRLAVAVALVGDPALIFLDEPTTGLDPQARRQLWDVVSNLRARGRTILLTTHYMEEAERLCDRVAVLDMGKIIAEGSPRELISRLGGDHVIEFSLENGSEIESLEEELRELGAVKGVTREAGIYLLAVSEPRLSLPGLLEHLKARGLTLETLATRHANLEDVFVSLTGRHLRDA